MILDTNAVSAFFGADPDLMATLEGQLELHLPVIVLGEYRFGLIGSRFRQVAEKRLAELEAVCVVLSLDSRTAKAYAELRQELKAQGTPIPENDIWIAALARQHRLPVVTRDQHFDHVHHLRRVTW